LEERHGTLQKLRRIQIPVDACPARGLLVEVGGADRYVLARPHLPVERLRAS
jgi:hypothetical protein